jgi:2,3-bisphosphoglycerate-independent phosphoglycerate mutase
MDYPAIRDHFAGRRPVLLIVLDGWGIGNRREWDAIAQAETPVMDRLWAEYPHTTLFTQGRHVGLPGDSDLGGSEVGHLTMGAGRILDQGPTRIFKAIADGSFFRSEVLGELIDRCRGGDHTLHLIGLLSDGNIHSHIEHFVAVIEHADREGVERLRVHALLDGRDVGIQSALDYTGRLEALFDRINGPGNRDYRFASGGGREAITMDRDCTWPKVEAGWNIHVHGEGAHRFRSIEEAILHFRRERPAIIDQDLPGFVLVDAADRPVGPVRDGDAMLFMNFRADRAVEFTQAMELADFPHFARRRPDCLYAGMMVYDEDHYLPRRQVMGPTKVDGPFGERLVQMGLRQFRLTETQKYPHVTFFFNGGRREPLDRDLEEYVLIASDKIDSFAAAPAMKAVEIADHAVSMIESGRFDFGLINFANTDMVGHTGDFAATEVAATTVDTALGRVLAAVEAAGGAALIIADHGNADEMLILNKRGAEEIATKHSINPVPCILFDPRGDRPYTLRQQDGDHSPGHAPGLSHIAATLFLMLGRPVPDGLNAPLLIPA